MARYTRPTLLLATLVPLALAACNKADSDDTSDDTSDSETDTDVLCEEDEVPYNGIDDDCDPSTLDDDLDQDGDLADVDCDDDDPARGPHADDIGWDGVDQDCDGVDLDATPSSPSLLVDLELPTDLLWPSVAVGGGYALVIGRAAEPADGAGLLGALVDLGTGDVTSITQDAPDTTNDTWDVVAWARTGGFGVLVAHEDWGAGSECHLYATPVGLDGQLGTRQRLTDVTTSQDRCQTGHAVLEVGGADHVFHFQPQRFLEGDGVSNLQVVRRVVDIDDGSESDVDGYGVYQGGHLGMGAVSPLGSDTLLAYQYSASEVTKVVVFEEEGLADNSGGDRIYGGLAQVLDTPALPVGLVSDGLEDPSDGTRTAALLRTWPDPIDSVPTLEWTQLAITPGDPNTVAHTAGGLSTPALVGRVPDLEGVGAVVAAPEGGYRAVWTEGGELHATTTTVPDARVGDTRLQGEAVALIAAAQGDGALVYLMAVGEGDTASLQLVTSGW